MFHLLYIFTSLHLCEMAEKKIYIWTTPRSLSCAFLRAVMSRDQSKGYMEPWLYSYFYSADRLSDRFADQPDRPNSTFKERKKMLEDPHEGFREVFVKEDGFRLRSFLEKGTLAEVLPSGYIHTFLIRNPERTVPSLYNGTINFSSDFEGFREEECSYDELVDFHDYVTNKLNQKSIIVDADDLQRDPESTLTLYCDAVGIQFQDSMIKWPPLTTDQRAEFEEYRPWVDRVLESDRFLKSTPKPIENLSDMPDNVQRCVARANKAYNKLYPKRVVP